MLYRYINNKLLLLGFFQLLTQLELEKNDVEVTGLS